jgi:hypothetical protein
MFITIKKLTKCLFGIGFLIVAISGLLAPHTASAVDRSYDVWRSSAESDGHYFLHDYQHGVWVETVDCRPLHNFTLGAAFFGTMRLEDASRDVYVLLSPRDMYLAQHNNNLTFITNGNFDQRMIYRHVDAAGGNAGTISFQPGCVWVESPSGFRFTEFAITYKQIQLYDKSRDLYVQLLDDSIRLRKGAHGRFVFFRKGSWQ